MSQTESITPDEQNDPDGEPGVGSGEGGSLGTPDEASDEDVSSNDHEPNLAVSGGGVVQPTGGQENARDTD